MNFELGDLLFVCCLVIFYEFKVEIIVYLLRKLLIFCYICKIISFILSQLDYGRYSQEEIYI